MIRVLLSERIKKTADKLSPDVREKASKPTLAPLLAIRINIAAWDFAN
jgi:hypothetical protein